MKTKQLFISLFTLFISVSFIQAQITDYVYYFKSSDVMARATNQKWIFTGTGPIQSSGDITFVNTYSVSVKIPLIGVTGAWAVLADSKVGWSGANPNDQTAYAVATFTGSSLDVMTYFYQTIGYNILGQQIPTAMYPFEPTTGYIAYSVFIQPTMKSSISDGNNELYDSVVLPENIPIEYIEGEEFIDGIDYIDINGYVYNKTSTNDITYINDIKINENKSNKFSLYPNPLEDQLSIVSDIDGSFKAVIYDLNGKMIDTFQITEKKTNYRLNIPKGNYAILFQNGQYMELLKFIKK